MLVIPAIDIKGGKCVRLLQGDPERETVYSDSPVDMAKRFQDLGAELIHVVDLDGAFDGRPVNMNLVRTIAGSLSIPIEIGGGIRNADTIKAYLDAGIKRIILGSAVLEDSFGELIGPFTENIIVGIDAREGRVAVKGWKDVSDLTVDEAFAMVVERGLGEVIYTDISTDGMLGGPNLHAYNTY
jgi:phosphoribosylformimino-5-aminoimidazole carboxamide ribotide isomerase